MALAQRQPILLPASQERRRFQRVKVDLLGRYMLMDRREYPCQVVNMSPGGIALLAPEIGTLGERVVAYIDHIGRVEGVITRIIPNGFAMTIAATSRKRDKLAAQLTWLANRGILGLLEDRRHERQVPRNPVSRLVLPNGLNLTCRIIDMSLSGAAIGTDQRPDVGTVVTIGKVAARVMRHLEDGFAVEFTRLQHPDSLEDNLTVR
ncbi:MAG: PilZ domain-containing protein [Xanthobacteraceae bacterium]|nr:MAG: PilZ domain-containing protein [Xanthobacteraceae bacterium]